MNLLWVGPAQAPESMLTASAPHPATIRWQQMMIAGMRAAGHRVRWIGHDPHRTWPWGPLFAIPHSAARLKTLDDDVAQVGYVNFKLLRTRSLRLSYRRLLREYISADRPDAIVTYNADPWIESTVAAAKSAAVPWFPIILECPNPLLDDWAGFRVATREATGIAFISEWAFRHAPASNKFLIPGAVVPRVGRSSRASRFERPTILYAGAHARAGGIDRLLAAMPLLRSRNVRLVITGPGKGLDPSITKACDLTPGVEDLGMVSEKQLEDIAVASHVLVNPRPIEFEDNRTNFPSKLLDYLSYGPPIVSTKTLGIPVGYEDVVTFTESDSPADIAKAIDEVLGWPADRLARHANARQAFISKHTPQSVGTAFAGWLSQCIAEGPRAA